MKKKLLITGAGGYIGQYMADAFRKDYDLQLCDAHWGDNLFELTTLKGADVLHLAAQTSVQESFINSQGYYYTNVLGTAHMARLCIEEGQTLYHFSSAAALHPDTSPYARSKFQAQELVINLKPLLKSVILMPFNVYADDPKPGTMLHHFLHDEEIQINGNGRQERDFIHMNDVTRIVKAAIDEEWEVDEIVQIGMGTTIPVSYVAALFKQYMKKDIVHLPSVKEIESSYANPRILKALFKQPFITNLEKDVRRMTVAN